VQHTGPKTITGPVVEAVVGAPRGAIGVTARRKSLSVFEAASTPRVSIVRLDSGVDPVSLRAARLRMGLTQHELARLINVAGGERISRWELGSSAPRPEILRRLAQTLNVDAADLLDPGGPADLRRLRTSVGLSARTLAARAHVSVPTYVRWESGRTKRLPDGPALKLLAAALNVTVEDVESAIVTARANASQAD
jgi:transcriptional regulator with XRE-family HTH domain